MKASLNLLRQLVDIKQTPEELAELLNERAFEVESVETTEPKFTHVIAARVLKIESHPNADRLRIVTLTDGKITYTPVVCGVRNFDTGDIVALALPGAFIPRNSHDLEDRSGYTLEKAVIRGVESQGMICAKFELGLTETLEEGIWVLDTATPLGTNIKKLVPTDTIFDFSLPANRPDLFSHLGIAREIGAVINTKVSEPKLQPLWPSKNSQSPQVLIEDPSACPKFIAIRLSNVAIGSSPIHIQNTLRSLGIKPINNIVDATNYAMVELGQPMHAFDAAMVKEHLNIRWAKHGENLDMLNHRTYKLDPSVLVIADSEQPLDIAGVMGGMNSSVQNHTTDVILTVAAFDGTTVRRAAQKFGLRTEASGLFEKGINPAGMDRAASRAVALLERYAGAKIEGITVKDVTKPKTTAIRFNVAGINKLLGTNYTLSVVKKGLTPYGITITGRSTLTGKSPWWRVDLHNEADLAEELLKAEGINTIKPTALSTQPNPSIRESSLESSISQVKEFWVRLGYAEVQNYSFISADDIKKFGEQRPHIAITNPLSADQGFLKRHLLIPLLKNIRLNAGYFDQFRLFEVGKQYLGYGDERWLVSGVHYSKHAPTQKQLNAAKGDAMLFLKDRGILQPKFEPVNDLWYNIIVNTEIIGAVGLIQQEVANNYDIDRSVVWFKFDLQKVMKLSRAKSYHSVSRFPTIERDISIIIDKKVAWSTIQEIIGTHKLLRKAFVFEADYLTQSKENQHFHQNLAKEGKKNLGIRLKFQAEDHTLTETEIAGILDQIMLQLKQKLGADIR